MDERFDAGLDILADNLMQEGYLSKKSLVAIMRNSPRLEQDSNKIALTLRYAGSSLVVYNPTLFGKFLWYGYVKLHDFTEEKMLIKSGLQKYNDKKFPYVLF